jgi:hypothetical protein
MTAFTARGALAARFLRVEGRHRQHCRPDVGTAVKDDHSPGAGHRARGVDQSRQQRPPEFRLRQESTGRPARQDGRYLTLKGPPAAEHGSQVGTEFDCRPGRRTLPLRLSSGTRRLGSAVSRKESAPYRKMLERFVIV